MELFGGEEAISDALNHVYLDYGDSKRGREILITIRDRICSG